MNQYSIIDDPKQLRRLRQRLISRLNVSSARTERRIISSPGGIFEARVNFAEVAGDQVFWWAEGGKWKRRATNLFGHAQPGTRRALNIEMQFNFPLQEFSRASGGTFLRDNETGRIVLAHRGIATHHRARVPKDYLFSAMNATIRTVTYSDRSERVMLIGELESPSLVNDLDTFVAEFRAAIRAIGAAERASARRRGTVGDKIGDYFDEFSGNVTRSPGSKTTIADCYHGDIIRALKLQLQDWRIRKNVGIDLLASRNGKSWLFEAKTSCDSQSIFTVVGQLMIHEFSAKTFLKGTPLTKVLVVPEVPNRKLEPVLKSLRIRVLRYKRFPSGKIELNNLKRVIT